MTRKKNLKNIQKEVELVFGDVEIMVLYVNFRHVCIFRVFYSKYANPVP